MLVFSDQNLVFLAVPKTGTTAVEMALKNKADIILTKGRKHTPALRYRNKIAPFLHDTFAITPDPIAVMRDPIEQIRSWFRYRSGPRQAGTPKGTGGCSFDDFVLGVIADKPPVFAGIGSQYNFLTSAKGEVLVKHLFAYERQPVFRGFLNETFGEAIVFKQKNVSPPMDAPLSQAVEDQLRVARAPEFALYQRILDAGGHLQP
ncbi:MAG: hypothetical protein P8Q26_15490 [Ascidiaceihabitans sp.]|nr:hypothetical protein [Ascidiaceihabitans sp.]